MDTVITVTTPEEEQLAAAVLPAAAETPPPEVNPLAEENARLRDELVRLKGEQKRREIAALLSELRASGQLTPAITPPRRDDLSLQLEIDRFFAERGLGVDETEMYARYGRKRAVGAEHAPPTARHAEHGG